MAVGKKVGSYYKRRPQYNLSKAFDMGNSPTTAEAQVRPRCLRCFCAVSALFLTRLPAGCG